jgi:hypothetical protein
MVAEVVDAIGDAGGLCQCSETDELVAADGEIYTGGGMEEVVAIEDGLIKSWALCGAVLVLT